MTQKQRDEFQKLLDVFDLGRIAILEQLTFHLSALIWSAYLYKI